MAVVTIKSLAEKAGVSYATVSLALNNDPRVAEKTKLKIQKLAKELNYVPNNFGRALQSNKSRLVGYLIPNITGSFLVDILQGIGSAATRHNYGLLVAIADTESKMNEQLELFREKRVDGIIASSQPAMLKELEKSGIPTVLASTTGSAKKIFPFVITDNFEGGKIAAEHLISLGHRKIVYAFSSHSMDSSSSDREKGMKMALKEHGIPELPPLFSLEELLQRLQTQDRPTGIICYSDYEAVNVQATIRKAGLRIPEDISITGFDDSRTASLPEYNFTTVAQAKTKIGELAFEMLLKRIKGEKVENIQLTPKLVIRTSTAKLN